MGSAVQNSCVKCKSFYVIWGLHRLTWCVSNNSGSWESNVQQGASTNLGVCLLSLPRPLQNSNPVWVYTLLIWLHWYIQFLIFLMTVIESLNSIKKWQQWDTAKSTLGQCGRGKLFPDQLLRTWNSWQLKWVSRRSVFMLLGGGLTLF